MAFADPYVVGIMAFADPYVVGIVVAVDVFEADWVVDFDEDALWDAAAKVEAPLSLKTWTGPLINGLVVFTYEFDADNPHLGSSQDELALAVRKAMRAARKASAVLSVPKKKDWEEDDDQD